jgi:hypothetical protein
MNGVTFEVRNRGGTHPRDNVYSVIEQFCEDPFGGAGLGTVGNSLTIPSPNGFTNGVNRGTIATAQFTISSQGYRYARRGFYFSPESVADARLDERLTGLPEFVFRSSAMAASNRPYLGKSLNLGKYITSGDLPDSMDHDVGKTQDNGGSPFIIDLNHADSLWAGAGYSSSLFSSQTRYRLFMEILALDGWTGAGSTRESLHLFLGSGLERITPTSDITRPYLALPGNAYYPGSSENATQDISIQTRGPAYVNGADSSYKLTIQQFRDGQDLEGRPTCNTSSNGTCRADSILRVGLDGLPADRLRIQLQRHTAATSFPTNQRLGVRNILVEPEGGYPRCSIKYQFRDSNQQSSFYCLMFEARTRCGVTNNGFLRCEVDPVISSSAESGVGFFPVSQTQKCFCKPHNGGCCIPYDSNGDGQITSADSCVANSEAS